ncbi:hypothetical protein V8C42DRAFT_329214 [Trichoderma barbatum]
MFSLQLDNCMYLYVKLAPPCFQAMSTRISIWENARIVKVRLACTRRRELQQHTNRGPHAADHGSKMQHRQGSPCRLIALRSACCSCLIVAAAIVATTCQFIGKFVWCFCFCFVEEGFVNLHGISYHLGTWF